MAEHKHGDMDIETQEKTFEGFLRTSTWVAGISIFALIFLALFNS
ncbi:aa3-type cytochrome c oxidase subunit IV [Pseudooceanicola spongiae]|jgi:Ni,Fe-hydrogenase I cytochrome b subunit|uniref:Aa3-type cytochrome c oxidase subunit IV n=1 Tax=Pseudooceanicola spongiae TaxID=2613965 RepID=A0A7L9WSI6_9RHOB|nr:aa3-type cytochrome c oxidase subunit IV [Pseudooceanicola spongiae]QOL82923.1 aa3-type cytochrome c oxidase subunit IV [Pseudooceanicola spongiae]|tara:strand:+ start:867 stop:1001 length:135 start_codon:yes stop_codon:yes gene_type:complete